jgi:hypothetical protein
MSPRGDYWVLANYDSCISSLLTIFTSMSKEKKKTDLKPYIRVDLVMYIVTIVMIVFCLSVCS